MDCKFSRKTSHCGLTQNERALAVVRSIEFSELKIFVANECAIYVDCPLWGYV